MPDTAKPAAGHSTLAFARLYADDAGESRFGPLAVTIAERNFAPPAPPLWFRQWWRQHARASWWCLQAG